MVKLSGLKQTLKSGFKLVLTFKFPQSDYAIEYTTKFQFN